MIASEDLVPSLISALRNRAHRLHLFPALRYLCACFPDAPPPGARGPQRDESLQFQHEYRLCFATQQLQHIELTPAQRVQFRSTLLSLCSKDSPLPDAMLHELALEGEPESRSRNYLNLFYHRLFGFLYRGRSEQDLAGQWVFDPSREGLQPWLDRFGLGFQADSQTSALTPEQQVAASALLTGHTATCARIASTCRAMLSICLPSTALLDLRVKVKEFQGGRALRSAQDWSKLGGARVLLGLNTHLGQHCPQPAGRASLEISGLTRASLAHLEVGGELHGALKALMDRCTPLGLRIELQLRLRCTRQEDTCLGRNRLGQDSWLAGVGATSQRMRKLPL